jgi:hypothetical protein
VLLARNVGSASGRLPKPGPVTVMSATHRFPSSFEALVLQNQREQQNKPLYNDVRMKRPIPALRPGEILVKINAAGFNHRLVSTYREVCSGITQKMGGCGGDLSLHHWLWIRRGQYPRIVSGSTLGADGAGEFSPCA